MGLFGRSDKDSSAKSATGNSTFDYLVVGLGNPGKQYARTRHNVGEEVAALLASRHGGSLKTSRDHALVDDVRIGSKRVVLAFPTTFMNESGKAVRALSRRYGFNRGPIAERLIVVHDELDLPPGVVRVKVGGGLAGHNGLRSITQHLKTQEFVRVRIGVGKPPSKERGGEHVLSKVPTNERAMLDDAVQRAADAVELILKHGADTAMQQTNAG